MTTWQKNDDESFIKQSVRRSLRVNKNILSKMSMAVTSEWVFLSSLLSFLSDSTPQTSLGEEKWTAAAQGTEICYQLKREQQTVR